MSLGWEANGQLLVIVNHNGFQIESRKGCLVVRPDSGDPAEMVLRTLTILGRTFSFSIAHFLRNPSEKFAPDPTRRSNKNSGCPIQFHLFLRFF